jgi:serine/threonine protein kinase
MSVQGKWVRSEFEFVREVDGGGQARVQIWRHRPTRELHAWKEYVNPRPEISDRIMTEATLFMRLDHACLIHGFYFFLPSRPGESAVIGLENMEGGSLAAAIQQKSLDATTKNCTIISLVKGLGHLHANRILHRDLKPPNVLFTARMRAKIGDFGSAFAMSPSLTPTRGANTFAYCAPELLRLGGIPSEASDAWSLALTIYETLTGTAVFDPGLPPASLSAAIEGPARPEVPPFVRPELKHVITSCWNGDPTRRMTIVEIDERLSSVGWILVEGADAKAVKEFLAELPLDEGASKSQKENERVKSEDR